MDTIELFRVLAMAAMRAVAGDDHCNDYIKKSSIRAVIALVCQNHMDMERSVVERLAPMMGLSVHTTGKWVCGFELYNPRKLCGHWYDCTCENPFPSLEIGHDCKHCEPETCPRAKLHLCAVCKEPMGEAWECPSCGTV